MIQEKAQDYSTKDNFISIVSAIAQYIEKADSKEADSKKEDN